MADRSISAGDTLNKFRFEFNGTAEDIGEISGITGASGIIASATDVVESITLLNTDLTTISTDNGVAQRFSTGQSTHLHCSRCSAALRWPFFCW